MTLLKKIQMEINHI